ncbi:MAG: extracellular solute-binding protein [Chloroflexi bacterium]|nr:extracellular solute-binding protein [Chloroflexota bacterium]
MTRKNNSRKNGLGDAEDRLTPNKWEVLTRRELLRSVVIVAGGLTAYPLLSGCAPAATPAPAAEPTATPQPAAAEPTATPQPAAPTNTPAPEPAAVTGTVETWSPDTRDDALASEKWWDEAFMKANPGVEVKQLTVPYGDDTAKFTAGDAAGEVPDISWAYGDFLFSYGVDGLGRPITDLIDEIGRDRFLQGALNGIVIEGAFYSVPFVGFPFFIYYRKDIYEEKGLTPPTTHEELLKNIEATHNPPDIFGYVLTNQAISDTWNIKTAMWTHGAYYFDEKDELALDRPETLEAWTFYKELGKYSPPGSMSQSDLESRALMIDGKVAHMFTTTSFSANFTEENIGKYGAFLYPSKAGAKGASLDFYGLVIPTKAKQPELAAGMIKFLLDPANFQEYLARTVIGWVPMLGDAYTDQYLNNPRIALVKEFVDIGGQAAANGVVGSGYFGPSKKASILISTDIEKQIGDRLVVNDESPEDVLKYALETISAEL